MKNIIKLILFAASIVTWSCNEDFLEREPLDRMTAASYYKSDAELLLGTTALYNAVWQNYNDKCMYGIGDARASNVYSNDRNTYYMFVEKSTHLEVGQMWTSLYNTIGQCNMLILNVNTYATLDNVSQEAIDYALGEAHFFRGLAYFYLVTTFGDAPIIYKNTLQMTDTTIAPNTMESIWKFIIRDMDYAVKHLTSEPKGEGRIDSWGAKGMLSKMYLYHSGFGNTSGSRNQMELDSAMYYAEDVIKNSPYKLMDNYYDLFLYKNENNPESLVALQFIALSDDNVKNTFQAYVAYEPKITGTGDGWGSAQGCSLDMLHYYFANPNDVRRKATYMFPLDTFPEILQSEGGYVFTGGQTQDGEESLPNSTVAAIKKYVVGTPDDNNGDGVSMGTGINSYMLRLAEVYLIYAEAILGNNPNTNDVEALQYFNALRKRAGVDTLSTITFDDIFQEKRIEFALEGVTWYDIVRWSYFEPDRALQYVEDQPKGEGDNSGYTIICDTTVTPMQRILKERDVITSYAPASVDGFYLPYPEADVAAAPNLQKDPVEFDFSVLGPND